MLALGVAAALLAGCSPDVADQRREVLRDVAAASFEGPVAFALGIEADEQDLAGFGPDAAGLAELLATASVAGVVEEDRVAAGLTVAGGDLVQVRVVAPGEQYVRFDLGALEATGAKATDGASGTAEQRLADALRATDLEPAARDAVLAAGRGDWVRLVPEPGRADGGDGVGTSVAAAMVALLRSIEPVDHTGELDRERFDGSLDVRVDPARALAAAVAVLGDVAPQDLATPEESEEALDGRVVVEDGQVRSVTLDLRGLGGRAEDGEVALVLQLRQLGAGEDLVRAPPAALEVTAEQLRRATAVLPGLGARTTP